MSWMHRRMLLGTTAFYDAEGKGGGGEQPEPDAGDTGHENPPPPGYAGSDAPKNSGDTPTEPNPTPPAKTPDPTRPEGLPDAFWDGEKNEIRLDGLVKSYNDTKKLVGEKEDAMRERLTTELRAELAPKDLPESGDKYELSEDLSKAISADDPMLKAFRDAAHEAQLPPAAFNSIVSAVLKANPAPDPAAEKAALGEHADVRIQRVSNMVEKHITDPNMKSMVEQIASTAVGVTTIETLLGIKADADRVGSDNPGQSAIIAKTKAEIKTMMDDPRYQMGPQQDPAYVASVAAAWETHHKSKTGA